MTFNPRGWSPGLIEKRYANIAPSSYSEADRTVECVISRGSPVPRFYGMEVLRIAPDAVVIDRLLSTGIPFLDSHLQIGIDSALGKFTRIWFDGGALVGKVKFNDTPKGRLAAGMIGRGEIAGVSAGYRVLDWLITDENGDVVDPEADRIRWDDTGLTFTATRWELLECSAVLVAADASAAIRSHVGNAEHGASYDTQVRMEVRSRMAQRQRMHDLGQAAFDKLQ
jgi:hypothetical protein